MKMSVATVALGTLLTSVALGMLLTSPALAQSRWQGAYRSYALWRAPAQAYALQIRPVSYYYGPRLRNRGWTVYDITGRYVGRDPDPHVRSMLAHDPRPYD